MTAVSSNGRYLDGTNMPTILSSRLPSNSFSTPSTTECIICLFLVGINRLCYWSVFHSCPFSASPSILPSIAIRLPFRLIARRTNLTWSGVAKLQLNIQNLLFTDSYSRCHFYNPIPNVMLCECINFCDTVPGLTYIQINSSSVTSSSIVVIQIVLVKDDSHHERTTWTHCNVFSIS